MGFSASLFICAQRPLATLPDASPRKPVANLPDKSAQTSLSSSPEVSVKNPVVGIPDDWSHHRIVFSQPSQSAGEARGGKVGNQNWQRILNDERYQFQQLRSVLRERWPMRPMRRGFGEIESIKKDWSMNMGLGATVGAGQYPAKYSFGTITASCSDFVVYNTGLAGISTSQANIVAYDNLYGFSAGDSQGCSGTVPSVYWAYFTGTGRALTSPILSADGTKVAFVENSSAGAILRILAWEGGEGTPQLPASPDNTYTNSTVDATGNTAWNATNCPSGESCLISVPLQNGDQDTLSAPFYVYSSADTIYVGDASGNLHQFTGVFNGTPAEVVTTTPYVWPIAVSGNVLTSPVYDSGASGNVFVADSGGYLYSFNGITAAPQMISSKLTAAGNTTGIADAPMLDPSTEEVYVFVGDDANTSGNAPCFSTTGCDGVFQFSATNNTIGTGSCVASGAYVWSGSNCGEEAVLGSVAAAAVYDGAFDHTYQVGTGSSGYLWVCNPITTAGVPGLSYVTIQSDGGIVPPGQLSGEATGDIASLGGAAACSPVTENWGSDGTTNDYIFLSVTANGNRTQCTGDCLYNFVVATGGSATTAGTFVAPGSPTAGINAAGGSSGIIIDDNLFDDGGTESQIYYTPLANQTRLGNGTTGSGGNGGCAIQTSQTAP